MTDYKIGVDTVIDRDLVVQTFYQECNGIRENLMRHVFHTQEEQFKQALIQLGWTPPTNHQG